METPTEIYFYSHFKAHAYMSNFYPVVFVLDELAFTSSEQYLMYRKALEFDPIMVPNILAEYEPAKIKAMGRRVQNYDEARWKAIRFDCMVDGLRGKFGQNPTLAQKLLETGDKMLYEASAKDRIWGIGYSAARAVGVPPDCFGQNLLGKALMQVRGEIQAQNIEADDEKVDLGKTQK